MRKAIFPLVCCTVAATFPADCSAQVFGGLYSSRSTPNLAAGVQGRTIANWLMTLPLDDNPAQPAEAQTRRSMFSWAAEAGELKHPGRPEETTAGSWDSASAQLLDSNPIGGEFYHFKRESTLIRPSARIATASTHQSGVAVWYRLRGRTANGEVADPSALTAGHRTLPFGSHVRVFNRSNGASVVVRINDRGPVQRKFVIDLSQASAKALGITGTAPVTLRVEKSGAAVAANAPAGTLVMEGRSSVGRASESARAKTSHRFVSKPVLGRASSGKHLRTVRKSASRTLSLQASDPVARPQRVTHEQVNPGTEPTLPETPLRAGQPQ
jgi:peptidoglycan lytic transglycosylase